MSPLDLQVSFSDGSVSGYTRTGDDLSVSVELWNGERISVLFRGVLAVLDRGVGDVSQLCESTAGELLVAAMAYHYEAPAVDEQGRFRLYQFLNLDDHPALEVVAESVRVVRG